MKGYKNVEVSVELLEEFRKVREEYYKGIPECLDYPASDSDLCYIALYSIINRMQDEINKSFDSEMESFCNPYF